jgi:hypothetical protein
MQQIASFIILVQGYQNFIRGIGPPRAYFSIARRGMTAKRWQSTTAPNLPAGENLVKNARGNLRRSCSMDAAMDATMDAAMDTK